MEKRTLIKDISGLKISLNPNESELEM